MMTTLKKRGPPIRQFSFQCDSPKIPERRRSLKKQFSEDLAEIPSARGIEASAGIRVSLSAKDAQKHREKPPVVKPAWSEIVESRKLENDPLQKNFIENKRRASDNVLNKLTKQQSLDKNMVFNSRKAAEGSVKEAKPNLNIFLGGSKDEELSDSSYSSVDNQCQVITNSNSVRPKLILPLNPDITNTDNMKSVFQKHIRKVTRQKSLFADNCPSPTRSESCSTIVVPVIANKSAPSKEPKIHRQASLDIHTPKRKEIEAKGELSRPSTAARRRELFQKRASSAAGSSSATKETKENGFRPPLARTTSFPIKPDPSKPKFVATKRRVKTAKAKVSIGKSNDLTTDDDELPANRKNLLRRCASVNGCEVETMVSLVSPSGSENEEEPPEEKEKQEKLEVQSTKTILAKQEPQQASEHRSFSLRKTVKSVSFQQSTIHAIRSFSASFPARRGSVATALFLGHSVAAQTVQTQKIQEKRAPVNAIDDDERVPKRRLIRTKSAPLQKSIDEETRDESTEKENTSEVTNVQTNAENGAKPQTISEKTAKTDASQSDDNERENPANDVKLRSENSKERQCWDTYCKMNEKGVTISFDTILRGMLTPTEYRLRSKVPSTVPEDNCEIGGN